MVVISSFISQVALYILILVFPVLVAYVGYLIITKAFHEMGFSSWEAVIIVFVSFLFGYGILDGIVGIRFSNIYVFSYNTWDIGINVGGAVIPILLSVFLIVKNKVRLWSVFWSSMVVAIVTFFVTVADPNRGIVAAFPFWLLPIICASVFSFIFSWRTRVDKAAPLAYISGTFGVLVGADVFHLIELLQYQNTTVRTAVIGGASVLDMVFITGILAVVLDGVFIIKDKKTGKE